MGRRLALAGAGLLLACPARADGQGRMDAALRVLAGSGRPADLDRVSAMLQPWPSGPRAGLWVAAAVAKSAPSASGGTSDLLRVAVLDMSGDTWRTVAAGEAEALADEPLWSVTLDLDRGRWRLPGGARGVGVTLGNAYNSTARSSATSALHLFRWQGSVLRPAFAALTRREGYDKDGAGTCVARRGYARPGAEGRQAPDAVMAACDRLHEGREGWSVSRAMDGPGAPGLVVRDGRGRIASRHRWTGTDYAPPQFSP